MPEAIKTQEFLESILSLAASSGMTEQQLSEEGKFLRRQLVLALTEDDRLHTDEVQRLWELVKDDLPPNRLLNVALNMLTEFSRESVAAILPRAGSFLSSVIAE